MLNKGTTGTIFITCDLPHSKPALYHYGIEKGVEKRVELPLINCKEVGTQLMGWVKITVKKWELNSWEG